jgi:murein DD-endopeptidase MepM/ murein hydrolase activator NlpD
MEMTRALAKRDGMGLAKFMEQGLDRIVGQAASQDVSRPPVDGEVSSGFGLRPDPLEGDERFHSGVDIAAPVGSPIKAVAAGTVVFSGRADGYGNLVAIDHGNGLVTRYAHIQANLVSPGQRVVAGQEIALVGTSGRSTGPHLHFEVRKEGKPVNPQSFLSQGQS